jgi:hypothetical protein
MTSGAGPLSDRDRHAIELAQDLRDHIGRWLTRRGIITGILVVSPFVDPAGQPSVLIRMNASAAGALLLGLDEPHCPPAPKPDQSGPAHGPTPQR